MINAAIVGLGWWGRTLVEAVSGSSNRMRFVAGATRTHSDDVKAFANLHKLDLRKTYEELIDDPKIDAVVLATPHSMHAEQLVAAAAKRKHVYCEKPFALTRAEAVASVAAAKAVAFSVTIPTASAPVIAPCDMRMLRRTITSPAASAVCAGSWSGVNTPSPPPFGRTNVR